MSRGCGHILGLFYADNPRLCLYFSVIGVCGVRILWIYTVFFMHRNFNDIISAYPINLLITALLIFVLLPIDSSSHKLQNH